MFSLTCVVDNEAASPALRSEHGLALWLESSAGVVLFDTGQTPETLFHNLDKLQLPLERIGAVVLSHAHYDHTGGLAALLERRPGLPLYAHLDLFRPRFSHVLLKNRSIGLAFERDELCRLANVHLSPDPFEVLPGLWTTGEINKRDEAMGTSSRLRIRDDDGTWQPDPHLDDLSLVWLGESGLTLICGCCHAGILNTLNHVQRVFNTQVVNIFGGIHLKDADEKELMYVGNVLRDQCPVAHFHLNHCTGETALKELSRVFQDQVSRFSAGMSIIVN